MDWKIQESWSLQKGQPPGWNYLSDKSFSVGGKIQDSLFQQWKAKKPDEIFKVQVFLTAKPKFLIRFFIIVPSMRFWGYKNGRKFTICHLNDEISTIQVSLPPAFKSLIKFSIWTFHLNLCEYWTRVVGETHINGQKTLKWEIWLKIRIWQSKIFTRCRFHHSKVNPEFFSRTRQKYPQEWKKGAQMKNPIENAD